MFSLLPTFQILPKNIIEIISHLSHYLLIVAMVGIGLKIKSKNILKDGKNPLIIGTLIFLIQILFSSIIVLIFY